ncbi:MAG: FHA domain-containing protein [Egibacteraceae bacterium]
MVGPAKRLTPLPMLVVTSDGPLRGRVLVIDTDEQLLGRRENCDLRLEDSHVSRAHAVIRKTGGAVLLQDLGSTGGTFLNGDPVSGASALRHGDIVRFGTIEARFEDRGAIMSGDDATELIEVPVLDEKPMLSPRQQEVLSFLKEGLTNPEIAVKLGVTERTVKAHCQEVFDRLGARNRTAAVAVAMRLGIVDAD